jgi:hypothetical protein
MAKPTIQQARDRAEVVSRATRPERVTSAGSLERLSMGNTRIPGIENRVISPEPPKYRKPLTVEEEKY